MSAVRPRNSHIEHPIITLFKPVLEKDGSEEAVAYLLEHPVLLSPYYTELLQQWAVTLGPADGKKAEQAIELKTVSFQKMRAGVYKISPPSLLELGLNVAKGNWTLEYAQQIASDPKFFVELMFPVVTAACEMAEKLMIQDWRPAVTLMKIVFAALDARSKVIPENQAAMEMNAVETWLAVVCKACTDVPDGRLFRDAVSRAEPLAEIESNVVPPAPILHRLGVLHLDTYVAGRSNQNLAVQMEQWRLRIYQEYGDRLAGIPEEELQVPTPQEALPKAVAFFRRAADKRTGEARGQTLKAMAQALLWQEWFGLPSDLTACGDAAREALTLLPLKQFPAENAELNQMVQRFDERADQGSSEAVRRAQEVLDTPVSEWLEKNNIISTIDIFHQNAIAVANSEPKLAVELLMAVDPLIQSQPESKRREHDHFLVIYAPKAFAPDPPKSEGVSLDSQLQTLFETARRESWPDQRVIYSLVRLAASTTETDQEQEGLAALEYLYPLARRDGPDAVLERLLPHLRALLMTGVGANAFKAEQFGEAGRRYLTALQLHLDANQPLLALDIVRRLVDLATPGRPQAGEVMELLVAGLVEHALRLELDAEQAATTLIQSTCRFAISALLSAGPVKMTAILFLLDVAKGRRFRAGLTEPDAAFDWLNTPRTHTTEKELSELSSLARLEKPEAPAVLDQNMLLTAYVGSSEGSGGGSATQQLRNLQIKFDRQLDRQLSIGADSDPWLPTIENLQALLDDKVILAIEYLGMAHDGSLALLTMLVTREDSVAAQASLSGVPSSQVVMSAGEQSVAASPLSVLISNLRDALVSPPGPLAVDSQAQETLENDYTLFFGGPLEAKLKEWRAAGKDHLCFCPHGPLHFYPVHLLGPEEQPLAASWCVTYLPHPILLRREQAHSASKLGLTSIGLNFPKENEFSLGELLESEGEAEAIAAVYAPDSKLLNGPAATEQALLQAMVGSRRVHISTHGLHNVSAPAFQCIFAHPDATDDGIVHAYELLRLDLRGLDLVTFSACETALGRFDIADNLRGIPAALLIAGVATIIGTLWNVETETATYFFTRFYAILKEKGSKKTAFYEAQSTTRAAFPKYRDWGAFQFIGSW